MWLDLGEAEPAVPAEGAEPEQAALLGPPGGGLRGHLGQFGDVAETEKPVNGYVEHGAHGRPHRP
jgi:hypothetical protein